MISKKILIKNRDGFQFAKLSKDFNKIHIDRKYGYNSLYGENIVHGLLAIIFFFKHIKIYQKMESFDLSLNFLSPLFYNKAIILKKKKHNLNEIKYSLIQNQKETVNISLKSMHKSKNLKKNFVKFLNRDLIKMFYKISRYTGMVYPGENSLISNISIYKFKNIFKSNNKSNIRSKLLDSRLPIINNHFNFKDYRVNFQTIKRPYVKSKKTKLNKHIIRKIKNLKINVLVIGASQGIGRDLFEILKINKKIIKIVTYHKNQIISSRKDVVVKKINLLKDCRHIDKIISKYNPIKIFYFPTPKILFDKKVERNKESEFRKFYVTMPLIILNKNKFKNISFFYPSTKYIDLEKNSKYSKIKKIAEKKITKFCETNKIPLSIHRFPAINSRQSISIINPNNPSLHEYLNSNKKYIDEILFN